MKKIILLLSFILFFGAMDTCCAADIIVYNTGTKAVLAYHPSKDPAIWQARDDVIIYDDAKPPTVLRPLLAVVPLRHLKVDNNDVVEMTQAEKDAVDAPAIAEAEASAILRTNIKTKLEGLGLTSDEADYLIVSSI